ncbi:MAG: glycosyltransferase family 2 protein [Anaerolineales bacterium]|nr:glycosyltransferase family 2 protein [Anaerolineales bacterium]
MGPTNNILALVPAWNEAERIGPVLEILVRDFPVLVVDDGSQDATAAVAREVGCEVIEHDGNKGKGVALSTGFNWAISEGFGAVLTIDADGQHDPREADKFVTAFRQERGDLIIGRRNFSQMPFIRRLGNSIGSCLLSRALHARIYDNQSGYRLHSRTLLESLVLNRTGFEFEVDVVAQAVVKNMPIAWVDIRTIYSVDKKSYFHPIKDSLRFLSMVWQARRTYQKFSKNGG